MFALLDFDWELTPRQWGTMVQTCMFRDDEKAPERLEQTDMEAVYELLTDVAVDALAPDGLTAFLARGTAPDGRVRFINISAWHRSLLPVIKT